MRSHTGGSPGSVTGEEIDTGDETTVFREPREGERR